MFIFMALLTIKRLLLFLLQNVIIEKSTYLCFQIVVVMILNDTEQFILRAKQLQQLKPAFVQNYVVAGGGSAVVTTAPGVVGENVAAISA